MVSGSWDVLGGGQASLASPWQASPVLKFYTSLSGPVSPAAA